MNIDKELIQEIMFTPVTDIKELKHHEFEEAFEIDNNVIIGKYRVMFGYRIRGGYKNEMYYEFDLCCGSSEKDYKNLLTKLKKKMESNSIKDRFEGIPNVTDVKPYINDDEFLDLIENW